MTERNSCKKFIDRLSRLNLYDEREDIADVDQILSTRIFLILILILVYTITMFSVVSLQTQIHSVTSPSETLFNDLSVKYSGTLSCPCTQSSISQKDFLSFNPQYHPICSSQLTNHSFISSYLSDPQMSEYWPLDYRIMMASHFQLLALFCQTIQQTVVDTINELSSKHIISNKVLFRDVFDAQISALIQQIKTNLITNYKHTRDFLWLNILENSIYSGLRTNYMIGYNPSVTTKNFFESKYNTSNGFCSCKLTNDCTHTSGIYNYTGRKNVNMFTVFGNLTNDPPLLFSLPGLLVGCFPYNSLLKSTLECFFNETCIDLFVSILNRSLLVSPLSSSYFQTNTTVEHLIDELLIESWNEISSFTNYYEICAPSSCVYSFNRRFSILYVVLTLISLFGGSRIVVYFLAPLISRLVRQIDEKRLCRKKSTNEQLTSLSVTQRLLKIIDQIRKKLINLNMFSTSSDIVNGIYATRVYLVLLISGIIILVFYASIIVRIENKTMKQPTYEQYEQLISQYSSSMKCPCSQLSISQSTFMTIQPNYHQICSSDFIREDRWLLYSSGLSGAVFVFDFRTTGMPLFSLLETFCEMTKETIRNELTVFYSNQFVSGQILMNETFHSQAWTLIQQFQNRTIATFLELFQLVQYSLKLNQFFVSGSTNAGLVRTLSWNSMTARFISTNFYDKNCSCGTNSFCTRAQGFYCRSNACFNLPATPNQTIPGLILSCLLTDSLLASSLQCLYDMSCIEMLIEWQSFGYSNVTIDPRVSSVTPLDPLIDSRFSTDTTLNEIVSQLFIESWTNSISFKDYFDECAPIECVYIHEERFDLTYIFSTVLGVIGGLSVTLKILSPIIVRITRKIYHKLAARHRELFEEQSSLIDRLRQINFYHKKKNDQWSEMILIHRQQIATRFYLIIFCVAIIFILIFTSLSLQNYSVVVSMPSESQFELLKVEHSSTLSCPCSQIATTYSKYISIDVSSYHQVCSSYFVSSEFIKIMWGDEIVSTYFWQMDRKILSSQFRLLSSLCSLAKDAIDHKLEMFSSERLITIETLTSASFQTQIDSIINNFIGQISADFRRTLMFITDMFHVNQLQNIFNTNWNVTISDANNNYVMSTYPIQHNETDQICSCATSSTCIRSILAKYNIRGTINGIVIGCLPMYGLRSSTLECFYNSSCLQDLAAFMDTSRTLKPLNDSLQTRFVPASTVSIDTLIDELFIETWQNSSNYSNYYTTCAPKMCQYTYSEKYSIVYIITTFLSLYGGLTVGLKNIIWYILKIVWKIHQYIPNYRSRVQPITA